MSFSVFGIADARQDVSRRRYAFRTDGNAGRRTVVPQRDVGTTVLIEFQVGVPVKGASVVLEFRKRTLTIARTVEHFADVVAVQDVVTVAIRVALPGGEGREDNIDSRLVAPDIATAAFHARRIVGDELHLVVEAEEVERAGGLVESRI